ncbi:creatininase family protein [Micromonospora sp. WMMD718]|uniref:creatininase family protein n=1 Tax=Micromonospora TaxID=1873 RepID=UPI00064BA7DB|nr:MULTISPECIES: creatininase family protein [unclassified Micromonospora]MDG4755816.1 creatininase family protein [Micromonospora sp. WMMD718]
MDLITTATSTEESERAASVAVLPVGSFEQHGAHLPLLTDTIVACAIAKAVAERYDLFLLPPVTVSCSHEHAAWRGTVSISATTLAAVVGDIAASLRQSGINQLAVINGHGGNYALANVVQEANVAGPRMTLFPSRADWDDARVAAGLHSTAHQDMHAGELEVSLLLHVAPEVVRDGFQHADHLADDRRHLLTQGMSGYTASGVIGLPSHATAAQGKAVLEDLVRSFADHHGLLLRHKA